jgi:hypothetical protein
MKHPLYTNHHERQLLLLPSNAMPQLTLQHIYTPKFSTLPANPSPLPSLLSTPDTAYVQQQPPRALNNAAQPTHFLTAPICKYAADMQLRPNTHASQPTMHHRHHHLNASAWRFERLWHKLLHQHSYCSTAATAFKNQAMTSHDQTHCSCPTRLIGKGYRVLLPCLADHQRAARHKQHHPLSCRS